MEKLDVIFEKYYLKRVESSDLTNIIGWRIVGARTVEGTHCFNHVRIELETDPEVWIRCFRFALLLSKNEFIILADPDCPEAYYLDNEFMEPMIKEVSQAILSEQTDTWSLYNTYLNNTILPLNNYSNITYDLGNVTCAANTVTCAANSAKYTITDSDYNQYVITNSSIC